jgi:hypothetical protein
LASNIYKSREERERKRNVSDYSSKGKRIEGERERETDLLDGSGRERLGSLEGHAESSVPDELGDDTEGSRNTEEDGVEVPAEHANTGSGIVSEQFRRCKAGERRGEEEDGRTAA